MSSGETASAAQPSLVVAVANAKRAVEAFRVELLKFQQHPMWMAHHNPVAYVILRRAERRWREQRQPGAKWPRHERMVEEIQREQR